MLFIGHLIRPGWETNPSTTSVGEVLILTLFLYGKSFFDIVDA